MRLGAILLLALLPLPGADWRELLDGGLVAEDSGQYDEATLLLSQACSEGEVDPAALREACLALARVHALGGKLNKSDRVLNQVVGKLTASDSAPDVVLALLQWSEVKAARSALPDSTEKSRKAARLLSRLEPVDRAHALTEMGSVYLAVGQEQAGLPLLYSGQAELLSNFQADSPEVVEALARNASILLWNKHTKGVDALLEPIIEAARRAFREPDSVSGTLYQAYLYAAGQYASALHHRGRKKEHAAFRDELHAWRKLAKDVFTVEPGIVERPRLTRRVDPKYTPGARAAGVTGTTILVVEIWPDGRAHNIRVLKPLGFGLSWNAITAVRQRRFEPGTMRDHDVKVAAQIEVNFKLR